MGQNTSKKSNSGNFKLTQKTVKTTPQKTVTHKKGKLYIYMQLN